MFAVKEIPTVWPNFDSKDQSVHRLFRHGRLIYFVAFFVSFRLLWLVLKIIYWNKKPFSRDWTELAVQSQIQSTLDTAISADIFVFVGGTSTSLPFCSQEAKTRLKTIYQYDVHLFSVTRLWQKFRHTVLQWNECNHYKFICIWERAHFRARNEKRATRQVRVLETERSRRK